MRQESELNTCIKNSIIHFGGWAYKIPDPSGTAVYSSIQRPFDGFGILNGIPIYWESKFSKTLKSFNLQSIQDHQIENLISIFTKSIIPVGVFIFYGVKTGRNDYKLFVFFDVLDIQRRRILKQNYTKKDLLEYPYFFNWNKELKIFEIDKLTNLVYENN